MTNSKTPENQQKPHSSDDTQENPTTTRRRTRAKRRRRRKKQGRSDEVAAQVKAAERELASARATRKWTSSQIDDQRAAGLEQVERGEFAGALVATHASHEATFVTLVDHDHNQFAMVTIEPRVAKRLKTNDRLELTLHPDKIHGPHDLQIRHTPNPSYTATTEALDALLTQLDTNNGDTLTLPSAEFHQTLDLFRHTLNTHEALRADVRTYSEKFAALQDGGKVLVDAEVIDQLVRISNQNVEVAQKAVSVSSDAHDAIEANTSVIHALTGVFREMNRFDVRNWLLRTAMTVTVVLVVLFVTALSFRFI